MPRSTPTDAYPTETSNLQADTEDILQAHVPLNDGVGGSGARALDKKSHLEFLARNLVQGFPARYTSQDASQPWLMFWTLQSFSALQVAIDPDNKQRCLSFFASIDTRGTLYAECSSVLRAIDTIMQWQHPDGGFSGGSGQAAHLLATYAAVCALAVVGRPGPRGGWDQIDRCAR